MAKKHQRGGEIAAGLAALAAAAAGVYFFYGERGMENRKKVKGLAENLKKEVYKKLGEARDINEKKYRQIVTTVARKYKNVDKKELSAAVKELEGSWKKISQHLVRAMGGVNRKRAKKKK